MTDNEIEITIEVKINAGVGFKVDRATWANATDEYKKLLVHRAIDNAAVFLDNDILLVDDDNGLFISSEITGPMDDDINLSEVRIYDPKA